MDIRMDNFAEGLVSIIITNEDDDVLLQEGNRLNSALKAAEYNILNNGDYTGLHEFHTHVAYEDLDGLEALKKFIKTWANPTPKKPTPKRPQAEKEAILIARMALEAAFDGRREKMTGATMRQVINALAKLYSL